LRPVEIPLPQRAYNATLAEVAHIIQREGQSNEPNNPFAFQKNEFTGSLTIGHGAQLREVTDVDVINATLVLERRFAWNKQTPSKNMVWDAVHWVASHQSYHPVKTFLTNTVEWDGKPRISKLLERYAGATITDANRELRERQSRAILLAAVSRVMSPGCMHHVLPVLIGKQGCGKSSFIRILATHPDWYSDTPLDLRTSARDALMMIRGVWLYEIAELRSFQGTSSESVKAFISSSHDRYRAPYARSLVTVPRQVAFIGTSNSLELRDRTGSRRFWPIPVESPDLDALKRDRFQLWAEAYAIYSLTNEPYHIDEADLQAQLADEADKYTTSDPWEHKVAAFARLPQIETFQIWEVLEHIGIPVASQSQRQVLRVARILRAIGATSNRVRIDGERKRLWGLSKAVPVGPVVPVN